MVCEGPKGTDQAVEFREIAKHKHLLDPDECIIRPASFISPVANGDGQSRELTRIEITHLRIIISISGISAPSILYPKPESARDISVSCFVRRLVIAGFGGIEYLA